jgi:hypothetical protein
MAPQSIAHYRVLSKLGEGGMGEVWRATDTKLNREVAIKILPASFGCDPARMARFEREASEIYVRPFPNASGGRWQVSSGGGLYALWSKNGHELFYETADNRIMGVDYTIDGGSFVPGKRRLWSDKHLFYTGISNLDLAPDDKRFAVFALPDTPPGEKGTVHVTMLFNFFDELRRRVPVK